MYGWTPEDVGRMTIAQASMYQRDADGKHVRPGIVTFSGPNAQRRAMQYAAGRR